VTIVWQVIGMRWKRMMMDAAVDVGDDVMACFDDCDVADGG